MLMAFGWELTSPRGAGAKRYGIILAGDIIVTRQGWARTETKEYRVQHFQTPGEARDLALNLTGVKERRGYGLTAAPLVITLGDDEVSTLIGMVGHLGTDARLDPLWERMESEGRMIDDLTTTKTV